jgi:hypothetical protein
MVRIGILSGGMAGTSWGARRFPVQIGRSPNDDLRLEAPGVWDHHFRLELDPEEGYRLYTRPEVTVAVNGRPCQRSHLRNGDAIDLGSVRLQFWLGETRQRGLKFRESLTWLAIASVCLGQVALVYWLLR